MCLQQLSVSGALYRLTASLAKSAFSSLTPSNRGFFEVHLHCHSYLVLRGIPWPFTAGSFSGRATTMGVHFASFIFSSGRSPPLVAAMASAAEILQFEHADLLISRQKLGQARGHRASPNQARAKNAGSVLQLAAVCPLWTACPGDCPRTNSYTSGGTAGSSFRSPAIPSSACRSGRTASSHLPGHPGRPAEEPDDSLPNRGRDAGELRHAYRRQGVSAPGWRFRADLRRDDLLWNRYASTVRQRWFSAAASTSCARRRSGTAAASRSANPVGGVRERHRAERRVLPGADRRPSGSERS